MDSAESANREDYIALNRDRIAAKEIYFAARITCRTLIREISDYEIEIADISAEVEEMKLLHPFEWQIDMNTKVFELQKQIARCNQELNELKFNVRSVIERNRDIFWEFPKAELKLFYDEELESEELEGEAKNESSTSSAAMGELKQVFGWVIGRLNANGIISSMAFGQFTRGLSLIITTIR